MRLREDAKSNIESCHGVAAAGMEATGTDGEVGRKQLRWKSSVRCVSAAGSQLKPGKHVEWGLACDGEHGGLCEQGGAVQSSVAIADVLN